MVFHDGVRHFRQVYMGRTPGHAPAATDTAETTILFHPGAEFMRYKLAQPGLSGLAEIAFAHPREINVLA